jgi:hypothetical protein
MNVFPRNGLENFSNVSSFYNIKPDPSVAGPYQNKESELRSDLFDAEFESYSEVSIDTSSDSSLKYKFRGNRNCFIPRYSAETNLMYGSSDGGTLSPLEIPEVTRSLRYSEYSDDEMSEMFSLDPSILHCANIMDEKEELFYLQELVHNACSEYNASVAQDLSEYDPNTEQDLYCDLNVTQEACGDYFASNSLLWKRLCEEEERLDLIAQNVDPPSFYPMLQQLRLTQTPRTQRKCKRLDSKQYSNRQHAIKTPKEVQRTPLPLSVHTQNKVKMTKPSQASDGEQRVFLGGLPVGMTERALRQQLSVLGYKVLKRPKILRGFAPEVLMRSVEEAKELVQRGTILMNGVEVEVRPFNSLMKQSESRKIPNIRKRSVFLGGLSDGTTAKDIQDEFTKMGIMVVNYPVIKFGFSRQVILENACQARTLIEKKKVLINGALVDVRPFMRQQSRKKSH